MVGVLEYEGGAGNLGPLLAVVNLVYLSVVKWLDKELL